MNPLQDSVSEARLLPLLPQFADLVRTAAASLAEDVSYFRVAQGLRSVADQNADWQKGRHADGSLIARGQPGFGVVTDAKGGYSPHQFGYAVDCYPFIGGCAGPLDWNPTSPRFQAMISAMKELGLSWGGDWQSIHDYPHFQMAGFPVTPTDADRAALASGGLKAVWARYGY